MAGISFCSAKAIREYFQTGKLVEKGTVCKPTVRPFVGENGKDVEKVDRTKLNVEDKMLLKTIEDLGWRR